MSDKECCEINLQVGIKLEELVNIYRTTINYIPLGINYVCMESNYFYG